ncbi:hypothetical protein K466DRAFT_602165 [Polyporus arcularius HHB13444]|uniref:F-box domain-containing protein n=1 Tax=Polyporus arcularius HHB13444 TaxID=1314778 RepID=A0A5C3P3L2_9APHY|nr:hypothetical protein K466DRAFT_602165 [Polyporus arcularius HHB13444]
MPEDKCKASASPRLPVELCERVIDAVYDFYYQFVVGSLVTLSRCALVCRAWRPRAQMVLFDFVLVRDTDALHRLAALLDEAPRLRRYVRRLALRGYLHIPASTVVLFPTILRLRLPNLTHVYLQEIMPAEKADYPLPPNVKELPAVPTHRYFPSVVSTFNYIRKLDFVRIRFCSFGDFGRVLQPLSNLQELYCDTVSWEVFGRLPPCMLKATLNDRGRRKAFLPRVHFLECYDMGEEGREALVAALGPSVSDMWLKFPNTPPSAERVRGPRNPVAKRRPPGFDLGSIPNLSDLVCQLMPGLGPNEGEREVLRATLVSWKATTILHDPDLEIRRRLYLRRWRRLGAEYATQDFIALLEVLGRLVEDVLCERVTDGSGRLGITMNVKVVVSLQGGMLERGRPRVADSFPTFSSLGRLAIISEDAGE